jgi:hypothetical protein
LQGALDPPESVSPIARAWPHGVRPRRSFMRLWRRRYYLSVLIRKMR